VPPPDSASREQILTNSLKKIPCDVDVNVADLVLKSDGFSGAEVVAITAEAVMHAVSERLSQVEHKHLLMSISEIKPQITESMLAYYQSMSAKFLT
jgi:SpoVK/Ycf46/Vps4 family AAA+-type ATPase